jgi:hypothetical protein
MPRKRIASSKLPAALPAFVGPFSSMQFHMALQVVQAAESGITVHTFVWLFLTVGKQVTFQVVVACKLSGAIGAFVLPVGSVNLTLRGV